MSIPELGNRQIVEMRPSADRPRPSLRPLSFAWESEAYHSSPTLRNLAKVLTIFLVGSECQFRCVMCDLWKYTHVEATRQGAIPAQIQYVLEQVDLQESEELWIKLYNASNFFAEKNVPEVDLNAIADLLTPFNRVIVENHPLLTNDRLFAFAERLSGKLEVAMGLETVHPIILQRLNKRMTLDDFSAACEQLLRQNIDVRSFVLLRPPGLGEQESIDWCQRAVEFATQSGVRDVAVIPLRAGNGAVEYLSSLELCELPLADSLERVLAKCVGRDQTIVTADLWDWDKLRGLCPRCSQSRKQRLHEMNLKQCVLPAVNIDCACRRS